jgi:hypothetical protein
LNIFDEKQIFSLIDQDFSSGVIPRRKKSEQISNGPCFPPLYNFGSFLLNELFQARELSPASPNVIFPLSPSVSYLHMDMWQWQRSEIHGNRRKTTEKKREIERERKKVTY